ncbi:MAG: hypothetical protein H0U70_07260 [Tatlockia sp.]|nr:hypothetical protein [Tatlockia sp.]
MDAKKILMGVAAAVVNVAAASNPMAIEKQAQATTMTNLLNGITVVLKSPECTIKQA